MIKKSMLEWFNGQGEIVIAQFYELIKKEAQEELLEELDAAVHNCEGIDEVIEVICSKKQQLSYN